MKLIILLVAALMVASAMGQSYDFPEKYIALVGGWVQDGAVSHEQAYSAGWMYVDNSIPCMRVCTVVTRLSRALLSMQQHGLYSKDRGRKDM